MKMIVPKSRLKELGIDPDDLDKPYYITINLGKIPDLKLMYRSARNASIEYTVGPLS